MPYLPGWPPEVTYDWWKSLQEALASAAEYQPELPWPFNAIQDFFTDLYNTIVNIPHRVWEFIEENLIHPIVDWMLSTMYYVWHLFKDTHIKALELIEEYPDPWKWFAYPFAFIRVFTEDHIVVPIKNYIMGGLNSIVEGIRAGLNTIIEPFKEFFDNVGKWLTQDLPNAISSAFWSGFMWLRDRMLDFVNWLGENVVSKIWQGLVWIKDKVVELLRDFLKGFVDTLVKLKDHAMRGDILAISTILAGAVGSGLLIFGLLDAASIKLLGSGVNLDGIKQFLQSIMPTKMTIDIFTGVLLANIIEKPLMYWAQRTFRVSIPGVNDVLTWYAKGFAGEELVKDVLAMHGFSDSYIEYYKYSVMRDPRFNEVFTAYIRGAIDREDYERWLEILNIAKQPWRGLKKPDRVVFEEATYRMPSFFALFYLLESGGFSVEKVKEYLRDMLIHPKWIDITANALMYRAVKTEIEKLVSIVTRAYGLGHITREALRESLKKAGKTETEIQYILTAADIQRLISEREEYEKILSKLYLRGYITREEYIQRLEKVGFDRAYIEAKLPLLEDYRAKIEQYDLTKDERNSLRTTLVKLYKDGLIEEQDVKSILEKLLYLPQEIELVLERARREREYNLSKLKLDLLEEMLKKGLISKDDFVGWCTRIGKNREFCEALGEVLHIRYTKIEQKDLTKDERNALANIYMKLAKQGYISVNELEAKLEELGFNKDEVKLRLQRVREEYNVEVKELWLKYYEELYRKGLIDADTLETQLEGLGIEKEKAKALRNYLEARYTTVEQVDLTKEERNSLRNLLLKLYKLGAISDKDLATRLAELGYTDEEINLMLERAQEEFKEELRELKLDYLKELIKQGKIERSEFVDNCVSLGYSSEKCTALAEYYYTRYIGLDSYVITKDERNALANTYMRLYKYGIYSEEELAQKLRNLGFSEEEVRLRVERAKAEAVWELIEYQLKFFDEALKQGLITETEYINQLVALGFRREVAEARAWAVARKLKVKQLLEQLS